MIKEEEKEEEKSGRVLVNNNRGISIFTLFRIFIEKQATIDLSQYEKKVQDNRQYFKNSNDFIIEKKLNY